ncbi:ABC transporter ATP-binding protein [Hydrogenophaga sp.]|uniref:ABC transporter ATP-binding protein n=1 Tax=Hydrogenophaga sp. TaxID=1904254 RepID=UPI001985CDFE|nr:ABC transporter ATP-binding protein [Hydrogenophaga sp.]MBD3893849.1 ABC transporter ATP-binding protein [Hydrogenophaga sp.]
MTSAADGVSVALHGCSKSYGRQRVLDPIDLQVEAGETLVLLGPSGCGKTTTLRLIAGLELPDTGQVWFNQKNVTQLPIEKRNVGMVFQNYALFPNMTVAENIAYGLVVRSIPVAQRNARVAQMLAMMHIESLAARAVNQLSGGQRQRVALARAIAPQPGLLLLDEPLAALDARLREVLRSDINELFRSLGITSIYVTHDQAEAMALGDRIAVMESGKIAQIGTPQDIYFKPANSFVADFIGTMNLVGAHRFRPEDVCLVPLEQASLRGVVVNRFFLGDHQRVQLRMSGGEDVILKLPPQLKLANGEALGLRVNSCRDE